MNASLTLRKGLLFAIVAAGLAACGAGMDDLDSYINEVKARPGGRIEPLPEITPYEVFTYIADAEGLRSPFVPDTPQAAGSAAGGASPDPERPAEFLESFPLDTLRMGISATSSASSASGTSYSADSTQRRANLDGQRAPAGAQSRRRRRAATRPS